MPRSRLAQVPIAALLAIGFIVLRVIYRIIFGGGGGDGLVLLDLPSIPLAGPFAGTTMLGPVTTGGIANTALSALPFAGAVFVLALLGVVVDLRALLTRGAVRGPVRTISRALVVAWSTFPALRDSVKRVLVARELRGERSAASLIVPVLEQTVERAITLGASMEVRGFAATRHPEPDCEHPVVFAGVSLGFEGRAILSGINLRCAPGTVTLISGATGSGKSTLLHAMSGLFQHLFDGDQLGSIAVGGVDRIATPPRETAGFVGVVSQAPRLSFVAPTVSDELGFALAIRGIAPAIVRARAAEIAANLGIEHLLDREIHQLSAGEACLVAIGAAMVSRPILLLVDEPLADLDVAARARIVGVLGRLAHDAGVCVVVAEHALREWDAVADSRLELRDGGLHRAAGDTKAVSPVSTVSAGTAFAADTAPSASGELGRTVVDVHQLSASHGDRVVVDDASFSLDAGEIVALVGPNGAGKSSLLLATARPSKRGTVIAGDVDVSTLPRRARRRQIALVPEAFDDLLFTTTVLAECRRADRLRPNRSSAPRAAEIFLRLLGRDPGRHDGILDRHPRDLSAGERLCLVMAIQLSATPRVLLVDEPTRGVDSAARALVGEALTRAAAGGAAVMVATHDVEFSARYASRTLPMAEGRLSAAVVVS